MFRSRSSVSYRMGKSRMGKKLKTHMRLLFLAGVALVAIVLTVIWGIVWGEQAQRSAAARAAAREEARVSEAVSPAWLPAAPQPICAAYLGRITTAEAAVAAAQQLLADGNTALSLPLYEGGIPRYDSAVAQAWGQQLPEATDVTLSRLFAAIMAQDGYVSAVFPCRWQQQGDPAMRHVLAAYEAALIAEIAQSGAHEVMLVGLDVSEEKLDEVADFLRDVRTIAPQAVIGIGVDCATLQGDAHVTTLRTLLTWADLAALDLADLSRVAVDPAQALSRLEPAIDRYRMRLLLPHTMYELLATIEDMGFDDRQVY